MMLKIMQIDTIRVIKRFLDSYQPSKDVLLLLKDIAKNLLVPSLGYGFKVQGGSSEI